MVEALLEDEVSEPELTMMSYHQKIQTLGSDISLGLITHRV